MYSRDIFPKYTAGGLPIPENYSGNAIRRTPPAPTAPPSGSDRGRVHTAAAGKGTGQQVPVTLSPAFVAAPRQEREQEPETERAEQTERLHGSMQGEDTPRFMEPPEEESPRERSDGEGRERAHGHEGEHGHEQEHEHEREEKHEREDGRGKPEHRPEAEDGGHAAGLSSVLASFLPPKPEGCGALSNIGLEEALLLGLFLLLSQSDAEDDTLMLLALLFLYR